MTELKYTVGEPSLITPNVSTIRRVVITVAFTLTLLGCSGKSLDPNVPPVAQESDSPMGLSWWSRSAINAYLHLDVWRGSRSGYVVMFARDGVPVYANAYGWADIESERPMELGTRMRFASMTKPVTAVAAMQLVEQGLLELDDPVSKFIPAFSHSRVATSEVRGPDGEFLTEPVKQTILIRHLLMFASGIGPGRDEETELWRHWEANGPRTLPAGTLQERIQALAGLPLFEEPGTRWRYGWSADTLAAVIEIVSGKRMDDYLQDNIFAPLGMTQTNYLPPLEERSTLATVYTQNSEGDLIPIVPESDTDYPEGGSGLVSTAGDYMRFALMLYNGGEYLGARIIGADTLQDMRSLHLASGVLAEEGIDGIGWGLGFAVVADADASLTPDRTGDFWWAGYFGTHFFVSPESGLVGVLLSQNEPNEYSEHPIALYVAQALAFAGLQ
ncbi:MAG: serine hydrolase domain-containing protein [Halioglobus sp.]